MSKCRFGTIFGQYGSKLYCETHQTDAMVTTTQHGGSLCVVGAAECVAEMAVEPLKIEIRKLQAQVLALEQKLTSKGP